VKINSGTRHLDRVIQSTNDPITQSPDHSVCRSFNQSMFWRAWLRSLAVKRSQSLLAFAALALGATVASLLLNVYGDAQRKMQRQFRAYGPNVVIAPAAAPSASAGPAIDNPEVSAAGLIDSGTVARVQAHVQRTSKSVDPSAASTVSVPVLYAVVSAASTKVSDHPPVKVVAVGADFAALHALNPAWKLSLGANAPLDNLGANRCLIGSHAAARLELRAGGTLDLATGGGSDPALGGAATGTRALAIAGLVSSGGPEDDQVFVPLDTLRQLAGLSGKVSLVEMRLQGTAQQVDAVIHDLRAAFPSVEVRPVREIVQSEGEVLGTIQALLWALAALILGVVVLCVMATVTTILLHRRKEVAVMKALGASDRAVFALLLAEIVALGIAGGLVGFAAGALLARRLGVDLFGVPLNTDWSTALPVLLAAVLVAALPALLPVSMVRSIDPARALKGE
jgi:putative ABC transport system permease protein